MVFAAEAALDEPCALPLDPPPSIIIMINHKNYYKAGYINYTSRNFHYSHAHMKIKNTNN